MGGSLSSCIDISGMVDVSCISTSISDVVVVGPITVRKREGDTGSERGAVCGSAVSIIERDCGTDESDCIAGAISA